MRIIRRGLATIQEQQDVISKAISSLETHIAEREPHPSTRRVRKEIEHLTYVHQDHANRNHGVYGNKGCVELSGAECATVDRARQIVRGML